MISAALGILGIVLVLLLVRPLTTFVHEMGHAIPALLFTKDEVVVYVGSYGDTDGSIILKTGRLITLFRYRITDWQLGLCRHKQAPGILQNILIVLGGPLFSLLLGLLCYFMIMRYPEHAFLTLVFATLLVSGILDFIVNMIPNENPLEMHDGNFILNDGSQLLYLVKVMNYPPAYFEGLKLVDDGKIAEGLDKLKFTIDAGKKDIALYRMIMQVLKDDVPQALAFNDEYFRQFKLQSPDFKWLGDLYSGKGESSFAIQCYSEAIRLNYKNQGALLQRAKRYLDVGLEQKALEDLKIVKLIDESNAEADELMAGIL